MWWWFAVACTPPEDARCAPPDGPRAPASIEDVFDLVDALPGPEVDVPCVLQALERPLGLALTDDRVSAQPAVSAASPRVFVRFGDLALSVVPEGPGRPLLELSEYDPASGRSRKAEVAFPVTLPLDRDAAWERVLDPVAPGRTICALCHFDEVAAGPGQYASTALRPAADTGVPLASLRRERDACDAEAEADRCAMLAALLDHGPVEDAPFPEEWPTIYTQPRP